MNGYSLNIAGYNIRIETDDPDLKLVPSERFMKSICKERDSDILIRVHVGGIRVPAGAEKVFNAPLIEDIKGSRIKKSESFWSIHKFQSSLFINTSSPYSEKPKTGLLKFSLTSRIWDLWIEGAGDATDPLEYPIDSLIMYYLTVMNGDIMMHASGVNHAGSGYIFSGVSGKGKTTIAKLWDGAGAKVIHDDRLIIRNIGGEFRMFNTPVYRDEIPSESTIVRIFLLEHGSENRLDPVRGASAVSLLLANCIQHNWNPEIIARLMGSVSIMSSVIPVFRLFFKPDRSIIDFLLYYE